MQNVPSPQEIFLPHTHNPTTSYLYKLSSPIAHMQLLCHQEEAQPEVGARDRDLGGPDFCQWAPGFSFPLCKGDPIDFRLAQLM